MNLEDLTRSSGECPWIDLINMATMASHASSTNPMAIQPKVMMTSPRRKPFKTPKWIMEAISMGNQANNQLTNGATTIVPIRRRHPRNPPRRAVSAKPLTVRSAEAWPFSLT